ncbi:MAG: G-D-S-L family lipolytic protein [Bacteroidetes bacterium]|nr:G-D-S-L family lipolytic protein [Bacteroidota bacterium]
MWKPILIISLLINVLLIAGWVFLVNSLGGVKYMWYKVQNRGMTGMYEHRKTHFEMLPEKENTIVFLGNSLTAECEWSEFFPGIPVQNRGISGDLSSGVLERLDPILFQQPEKIFLMIGINDLLFVSPEHIADNYRKIIKNILRQSPHTKLFLQSVLPVNNSVRNVGISNQDILRLNTFIRTLSEEFKLEYIDLHKLLANEEGELQARFTVDGLHINGNAYLIWKKAIDSLVSD